MKLGLWNNVPYKSNYNNSTTESKYMHSCLSKLFNSILLGFYSRRAIKTIFLGLLVTFYRVQTRSCVEVEFLVEHSVRL